VALWVLVALAALNCARRRAPRWAWLVVALSALVFASEIIYPLHLTVTDQLRELVRAVGGVEAIRARRGLQVVVIACVVAVSVYLLVRLVRTRHLDPPVKLALAGAGIGWTGLVLEVISLHHLDQLRFFYPALRYSALAVTGAAVAWALGRPSAPPASC
jgi:hypothetical protein